MKRTFWIAACATTVALSAPSALAKEQPLRACSAAYQGAQERQRAGHLRQARELLLECAKPTCGGLQRKCASGAGQLSSRLAWISPVVTDAAGTPLADVQVKVDGEPWTMRLDGHPLPVDPGLHEFSFSARVGAWPGRDVSKTQKIMVWQGQRGPISITLPAPDDGEPQAAAAAQATAADAVGDGADETSSEADTSAFDEKEKTLDTSAPDKPGADKPGRDETPGPEPSPAGVARRGGPSAFAYVLGSVGVLGLGAGGLLTYWGKTDNDALGQCSPNCRPSSVDHIKRMYLAADLSFAGGAAALGVSALLFATSHSSEVTTKAGAKPAPARAAYQFDVRPTRSGAFASFEGAF
jgi:hypothetical protein